MWLSPQPLTDSLSALAVTRFPTGSVPRPPTVTEEAEKVKRKKRETTLEISPHPTTI